MKALSRRRAALLACLSASLTLLVAGCSSMNATPDTDDGSSATGMSQLTGAEWFIEDIGDVGVIDATEPSIGFSDDDRVFGNATCNRIVGTFEREDDRVSIGPLGSTMMACPEAEAEQERALFALLADVDRFEIGEDGSLVLHATDGRTINARRR